MKPPTLRIITVNLIPIAFFAIFPGTIISQINVYPGPNVTPGMMVENITGKGIQHSTISFQGAPVSRGIFTNGQTTNLGLSSGVFLTNGSGYIIPGPNNSCGAGVNNGYPGHPLLTSITYSNTYDAGVLTFDFNPASDTIMVSYVYGSEEYPGWGSNQHIDVFGFFVSGPNPAGGLYNNRIIARIPDTSANYSVIDYMYSNWNGQTLQYDGFTTVLSAGLPVVPFETYHILLGVADVGDGIFDSGIFIGENSLISPGPVDFIEFAFKAENNPLLDSTFAGTILNDTVLIHIPFGFPKDSLIASFSTRPAVLVSVNNVEQLTGVSVNDFSAPVFYTLVSWNGSEKEYTVLVHYVENDILAYAFLAENNAGLVQDHQAIITDTIINVFIDLKQTESHLVANFVLSDSAKAYITGDLQISGVTQNDFTSDLTYQVRAENEDIKEYIVKLTNSANDFISYGFDPEFNPGLSEFAEGLIGEGVITVIVPENTDLTGLVATFKLPFQAEASVFGQLQVSGETPNNFTNPKIYNIEAGNGFLKDYLVVIETAVGIDHTELKEIHVFPNPASDHLGVRNAKNAKARLFSITGKLMIDFQVSEDFCQIDINSIPDGVYYLHLSKDGNDLVQKVIVSRSN